MPDGSLRGAYERTVFQDVVLSAEQRSAVLDRLVAPSDGDLDTSNHPVARDLVMRRGVTSEMVGDCISGRNGSGLVPSVQPYRKLDDRDLFRVGHYVKLPSLRGMEVLARAHTNNFNRLILPGHLFSQGADAEQIAEIDFAMARWASKLALDLTRDGHLQDGDRVASNVYDTSFQRADFADRILAAVKINPRGHMVELVENIRDVQPHQIESLRRLIDAGIALSMDDLGQNHSVDTFRALVRAEVQIVEVKFDGMDMRSWNLDLAARRTPLIEQAVAAGVERVVWEGYWQGVQASKLRAIQRYVESLPSRLNSDIEHYFEGTVAFEDRKLKAS